MVQFLSINFLFLDFFNFCWVFQKFPFFIVSPCISKRFPVNEYKRKWPKITTSVERYTFRNNSGTLAASYRKNERRKKRVYWA